MVPAMPRNELLSLYSPRDVQIALKEHIKGVRKQQKLSREGLSERSGVPAPTIRHFENTGEISLRQFLMLLKVVDSLEPMMDIARQTPNKPKTIDEVGKV